MDGKKLEKIKINYMAYRFLKSYPKERKCNINFHNIFKIFLFFM